MTTNNTPNLKKDTNPNSRWEASKVNEELVNLDTATTNLTTGLVTTDTNQTITSQKTFYSIYPNDSQITTYDSIMDELPYNISPIFGASTFHFLGNKSPEEGSYNKDRPDGVRAPIAELNPIFFPSDIFIEVGPGSTSTTTNGIYVTCKNIPFPKISSSNRISYDLNEYHPIDWNYSGQITTRVDHSKSGSGLNVGILFLNYNRDTNTHSVSLATYMANSGVFTDSNYHVVPLGVVFGNGSNSIESIQSNGVLKFKTPILLNLLISNIDNKSYLKLFKGCILKVRESGTGGNKYYSDGSSIFNHQVSTSTCKQSYPSPYEFYLPWIHDEKDLIGVINTLEVLEIHFGDLLGC